MAVAMVLVAAFLDGIDGRVARLLRGPVEIRRADGFAGRHHQFRRGAGACALCLHSRSGAHLFGWIAAIVFAVAAGLRLAPIQCDLGKTPCARPGRATTLSACRRRRARCWCCCRSISGSWGCRSIRVTGFASGRLHHLHRLPADQPGAGLFGQGHQRRGCAATLVLPFILVAVVYVSAC